MMERYQLHASWTDMIFMSFRGRCNELISFWQFVGVDKNKMAGLYFTTTQSFEPRECDTIHLEFISLSRFLFTFIVIITIITNYFIILLLIIILLCSYTKCVFSFSAIFTSYVESLYFAVFV